MKRHLPLLFAVLLLAPVLSAHRPATRPPPNKPDIGVQNVRSDFPGDAVRVYRTAAAVLDTFVLAEWDFFDDWEPARQGWIAVDATADPDTFFHVASDAELDGGDFGGLVVLEGEKSLWCGTTGLEPDLRACYYAATPGYGGDWAQNFVSVPFARTGDVTLSFLIRWDSEAYHDRTTVYYVDKDGELANAGLGREGRDYYDGAGFARESVTIPDSVLGDSVRFWFRFTSDGAWNDEDGLWDTDGAVIVDSIVVTDASGRLDFQDFESEPDGAKGTGDGRWRASPDPGFGDFAGLYFATGFVQEDPCVTSLSGVWAFVKGSTDDYACGGFPEQAVVPYFRSVRQGPWTNDLYIANEVWSPPAGWTSDVHGTPVPATATSAVLEFDVYRDLPLDALVFYSWNARGIVDGCPLPWPHNPGPLGYGGDKDWYRHRAEIAPLVAGGAEQFQVSLGVFDGCAWWCGVYGSGACHSHAPLFGSVRVVRVDPGGPLWDVSARNLFQDNFAADGSTTGTVYIDGARRHVNTGGRADSTWFRVTAPDAGLGFHVPGVPGSGPAVYIHVGEVSPAKSGDAVSGDPARWPAVVSSGGWTVLVCDTVVDPFWEGRVERDHYCVDLNDNLFTPGDTVWYYFSARDANGRTTYYSSSTGPTPDPADVQRWPMEVTCLPANGLAGAIGVLYVDACDDTGVQPYFDAVFRSLGITPDRYDVLAPTSRVGNGLAGRVVDPAGQVGGVYRTILWSAGGLRSGTIGDGSGGASSDFALLFGFLNDGPDAPGLYLSGDHVAEEWFGLPDPDAVELRATYMNFDLVTGDHALVGEPVSPLVFGSPGGMFAGAAGPDTLVAHGGGCTSIADFDVLAAAGASAAAMNYSGNPAHGAVLSQATENAAGDTARVVLSAFSFHRIRDDRAGEPYDRAAHLAAVLDWLRNGAGPPTGAGVGTVHRYRLSQNYPNPFNPATTIAYELAERGRVSLAVYDVAGRLVRTLVDAHLGPGRREVAWDGRDNRGVPAASGIYFCRIRAGAWEQTRKMVLLR